MISEYNESWWWKLIAQYLKRGKFVGRISLILDYISRWNELKRIKKRTSTWWFDLIWFDVFSIKSCKVIGTGILATRVINCLLVDWTGLSVNLKCYFGIFFESIECKILTPRVQRWSINLADFVVEKDYLLDTVYTQIEFEIHLLHWFLFHGRD